MRRRFIELLFVFYRPLLILLIVLSTGVFGSLIILVSPFDKGGFRGNSIGRFWARLNLFLTGVAVRLEGLEHLQAARAFVVMSNHQSHYDVLALIGYLPLQLRWVMKKELRHIPIFGWACERMGQVYIDRGDSEQAKRSLAAAGEKVRGGLSVVIFPEGTRSADGHLLPFKKGGAAMAVASGATVLPITVNHSRFVLPRGTAKPLPGTIEITIHPPISASGYTAETKDALTERVRAVIEGGLRLGSRVEHG